MICEYVQNNHRLLLSAKKKSKSEHFIFIIWAALRKKGT